MMMNTVSKKTKIHRVISVLLVLVMMFAMCTVAFAAPAGDDIFQKAQTLLVSLRGKILGISTALCAVALIIAGCMWGFGSKQTSQQGWEWIKRILIAYVIINLVPTILITIGQLGGFDVDITDATT